MIKTCIYSVVALVFLATCCDGASFDYSVKSEEKRLWFSIVVPPKKGVASDSPGFLWQAKLRLFTKPPIWGTALANIQLQDLDWNRVRSEAAGGNPEAAYLLAHKLMKSNQLHARAAYWLDRAAALGHGPAENDLGILAMFGLGVTRDVSRAAELFERAASKGVAMGHLNIGLCRLVGVGCRRSTILARTHIKRAAAKKLPVAEVILAVNYAVGTQVVLRDFEKAYELVLLARAHGSDWPLEDDSSRNFYYVGIDELDGYLERLISNSKLKRIQNKLSNVAEIYSPPQITLVESIKLHAPEEPKVVVFGPEEVAEETE
jgi:hypothetical protein